MPKWCVESYPSSLYKFEKTRFWHFVTISGRGQGGPNPCLIPSTFISNPGYTFTLTFTLVFTATATLQPRLPPVHCFGLGVCRQWI